MYRPTIFIGAVDSLAGEIVTASSRVVPSEIAPELKAYTDSSGSLGAKLRVARH